ncbi:carbon-nitrogen hydrolase family protein [Flexibacterium corallicola]|uniref:carbon-nitrogen hydrolase family protein n=1 Tax=Flexibacterium corallicola TaxID=3037259 RepID=UPI00286F250F|nr:carbon-nitrogen hydrolase family protein [Pseudovibrio sp. M1P-2-3]
MEKFLAACVQMRTGRSVSENLEVCETLVRMAAGGGARYIQTPEMTNLLEKDRRSQLTKSSREESDLFLKRLLPLAAELGVWLHLGSLAIKVRDDKLVNRGFFISPKGEIIQRYDKVHMFDVNLPNGETWCESSTYESGSRVSVIHTAVASIGMAICYDLRQPAIFREQAKAGAQILTAPSAFTRQTGEAHWHVLQRARAIENGAYMISAAQGGDHEDGRSTFGHSMVVDPWGKVVAELDHRKPDVLFAEIDLKNVAGARKRIPALANEKAFVIQEVSALGAEEIQT